MKGSKLKYCYNVLGVQHFYAEAGGPLPTGDHQVRMEFAYRGGGLGKADSHALWQESGPRQGCCKSADCLLSRRWLRRWPGYLVAGVGGLLAMREKGDEAN